MRYLSSKKSTAAVIKYMMESVPELDEKIRRYLPPPSIAHAGHFHELILNRMDWSMTAEGGLFWSSVYGKAVDNLAQCKE